MFFASFTDILLPFSTYLVLLLVLACIAACTLPGSSPRTQRTLLALAAWAWVFSTPALANLWMRELEGPVPDEVVQLRVPQDPDSLVVILASGEAWVRGGRPQARLDLEGWERLTTGVELWRRTGGKLLLTGGLPSGGQDPSGSFAELMARHARAMGVPEEALKIGANSTRTQEDLAAAAPLVQANAGPVYLVTSALHMRRSVAVAERLGLRMQPFACGYRQLEDPSWRAWLPNAGGPALFSAVLHEVLGLAYYRVRGWA